MLRYEPARELRSHAAFAARKLCFAELPWSYGPSSQKGVEGNAGSTTECIGDGTVNPWLSQNGVGLTPDKYPREVLFVEWFVGYTDAEGAFLVSQRVDPITGKPTGGTLIFQIRVHVDSLPLLYWLRDNVFGCGSVTIEASKIATYKISPGRA